MCVQSDNVANLVFLDLRGSTEAVRQTGVIEMLVCSRGLLQLFPTYIPHSKSKKVNIFGHINESEGPAGYNIPDA